MNHGWLILFCCLLLIIIPGMESVVPAATQSHAQGDNSDDIAALIPRFERAAENLPFAERFQQVADFNTSVYLIYSTENGVQIFEQLIDSSLNGTYTIFNNGDTTAVSYMALSTFRQEESVLDEVSLQSIDLEIEGRLLDETVYVRVDPINLEGDTTIAPPDGWFSPTSRTELTFTGAEESGLGILFDFDLTEAVVDPEDIAGFPVVFDVASDIAITRTILDDGTEVDVVTVTFLGDAVITNSELLDIELIYGEFNLFEGYIQTIAYSLLIALDDEDNVRGLAAETTLAVEDLPAEIVLGEEAEPGSIVDLGYTLYYGFSLTYLNADLPPVVAPDLD